MSSTPQSCFDTCFVLIFFCSRRSRAKRLWTSHLVLAAEAHKLDDFFVSPLSWAKNRSEKRLKVATCQIWFIQLSHQRLRFCTQHTGRMALAGKALEKDFEACTRYPRRQREIVISLTKSLVEINCITWLLRLALGQRRFTSLIEKSALMSRATQNMRIIASGQTNAFGLGFSKNDKRREANTEKYELRIAAELPRSLQFNGMNNLKNEERREGEIELHLVQAQEQIMKHVSSAKWFLSSFHLVLPFLLLLQQVTWASGVGEILIICLFRDFQPCGLDGCLRMVLRWAFFSLATSSWHARLLESLFIGLVTIKRSPLHHWRSYEPITHTPRRAWCNVCLLLFFNQVEQFNWMRGKLA